MATPLNLLIVEDSQDDTDLMVSELLRAGFVPTWKRVETETDFLAELNNRPDIILSDYSLPRFSGLRAAELLQATGLNIPFILISGTVGEDVAVEAMRHGATDYLLKDRIARLGSAVERALREKHLLDEQHRDEEEKRRIQEQLHHSLQTQAAERKQAEAALSETEERYRALFDRSMDCVFLNDFDGNFLDANQASLDLLGYQREDIPTLTFTSLLTDDQVPLALQATEEIKRTGSQKHPTEFRLHCKDGSQVCVETQSSLIYRGGKPFAIQGIARDLTERRRAQELLFASEQRLNAFFTKAPAGLVLLDKQLRFVQLNETVANVNGVPVKDHLGKTVREVLPKLAPLAEPLLQQVLATGEPVLNIELSGETPSQPGVLRHWLESFFPILGKDGNPEGIGAIFVEITERKRVEESLRQSQERYVATERAVNDGLAWRQPPCRTCAKAWQT